MTTKKEAIQIGMIQRYLLIGAAIGLYYGLFYRSSDVQPDYGIAIMLSVLAALITVVVRFWKKKQPFPVILKYFFEMLLLFSVFLLTLAIRQLADQIGGRFAVVLVTTLSGIGLGYFMATRKKTN